MKKMIKEVSIIIPVFNVELYINRCLDSLLNQSIMNFEIICIDDGSKDNSLKILKKYETKYDFIKVYTQKNMGPAKTRNKGIELAKYKYIMFIDSDDYVESNYVETFYKSINKTKYDIVMGGFKKTDGENISFKRKLGKGSFSKYIVTGPCSKILKKDFLKKNKIEFLDTNSSEDVYFTLNLIKNNARIKTINYMGYYYFYNEKSLSNTLHKGFNQDVEILELLDSINHKKIKNVPMNQYYIIRYCVWYLLYSGKNSSSKKFIEEYKKLFSWLKQANIKYKSNKYVMFFPLGEIIHINLIIKLFVILDIFKLIPIFSRLYCKNEEV